MGRNALYPGTAITEAVVERYHEQLNAKARRSTPTWKNCGREATVFRSFLDCEISLMLGDEEKFQRAIEEACRANLASDRGSCVSARASRRDFADESLYLLYPARLRLSARLRPGSLPGRGQIAKPRDIGVVCAPCGRGGRSGAQFSCELRKNPWTIAKTAGCRPERADHAGLYRPSAIGGAKRHPWRTRRIGSSLLLDLRRSRSPAI